MLCYTFFPQNGTVSDLFDLKYSVLILNLVFPCLVWRSIRQDGGEERGGGWEEEDGWPAA